MKSRSGTTSAAHVGSAFLAGLLVLSLIAARTVESAEPVRLGLAMAPSNALTIIAVENGYFADEGLDVAVEEFPSGKRALNEGLFAGRVDFASSAGVPIVFGSFSRSDFRVLACFYTTDDVNRIVARRDRGIAAPEDLRGKRVATQRASAVHFFLHLFHLDQGLTASDLEIAYMKAERLPVALAAGEIDAFSMREPFVGRAVERLGDNAIVFSAPGLYVQSECFVASQAFVASRPDDIEPVLRALVRAEDFAREHPQEAARVTARRLGSDPAAIAKVLAASQLRVHLPQALLPRFEEMAVWAIEGDLVDAPSIPDYYNLLYIDGLRAVRPTAVTVID